MKFISLAEQKLDESARVEALVLEIGEMTGVLPEYLHRYYPQAVKGTVLEGSRLEVISVPAKTRCLSCGEVYEPNKENGYLCPRCKSPEAEILSGRELILKQIRVLS